MIVLMIIYNSYYCQILSNVYAKGFSQNYLSN